MRYADVVVVGGGQAGLAVSYRLAARGLDHVVLERNRIGERWRTERWDSLRLITPNWMTRLPGRDYQGADPDGFMPAAEMADVLEHYARSFSAPVETGVAVTGIERQGEGYRITTDRGVWVSRSVVVATGGFDAPHIPETARALSPRIRQVVPSAYRNPDSLPPGGVLVVGASATGVQLAEEIHHSGRPVMLAVGRHTRLPRAYRGYDIMWWLDRLGMLDERIEDVPDPEAARNQPSLQLAGGRSLDLAILQSIGVRLVGRAIGFDATQVRFAGDLAATTAAAEAKLRRILANCDQWAERLGLSGWIDAPELPRTVQLASEVAQVDLARERISSVIWATGFQRSYPWLQVNVLGSDGEIVHRGGVTRSPGLYAMGLRFMRRRKSSFIDGAGPDAEDIVAHLAGYLAGTVRRAA